MSKEQFEHQLAYHCAPTLRGLKAASMVAFSGQASELVEVWFKRYQQCFMKNGLRFLVLREQKRHVLVLLYRPEVMARLLRRQNAQAILKRCGYGPRASLDQLLHQLWQRFQQDKGVPHEIGLFLGYPPHDVAGFIRHQGHNYIFSGFWKVYDNELAVRQLFLIYQNCTEQFCQELEKGTSLQSMVRKVA